MMPSEKFGWLVRVDQRLVAARIADEFLRKARLLELCWGAFHLLLFYYLDGNA